MILADNRKVRFDYDILDTIEAGIVLEGWEVKSLRAGNANIKGGWVRVRDGEAFLTNTKIAAWKFGETSEQKTTRDRKLLLHKKEILKLEQQVLEKKVTLVPYKLYLEKGKVKCEIVVGKGRKRHEKKQVLKERDLNREARQALKRGRA